MPMDELAGVVAVVLTHEHPDHWTSDHLDRIRKAVPDVPIYGPQGVADAAPGYDIIVVNPGDTVTVGPFTLRFFGGTHAVIHSSIPVIDNVGVLVNEALYYPGDSYAVPAGVDVRLLAAPLGAPWLKVGDAMDFVLAVAPQSRFRHPRHDTVGHRPRHAPGASQVGDGAGRRRVRRPRAGQLDRALNDRRKGDECRGIRRPFA